MIHPLTKDKEDIFFFLEKKQTCVSCVSARRRRSSTQLSEADLGLLTPKAWRWCHRNASAIDAFPAAAARPRGLGKRRFRHKVMRCIGALYLLDAARNSSSTRRSSHAAKANADARVFIPLMDRRWTPYRIPVFYNYYIDYLTEFLGLFLEQSTVRET